MGELPTSGHCFLECEAFFSILRGIFDILSILEAFLSIYLYSYLHIIYIIKHETHYFNIGSDSTSVEHWSLNQQVPGSDLTSAVGAML